MKLNIIDDGNDYSPPSGSHLTSEYLKTYGRGTVFVETGTYYGDTVNLALSQNYKSIHTIELDPTLCERARRLFEEKDNVQVWLGDSIHCLRDVLTILDETATFWLDAHASGNMPGGESGGSPVLDELNLIKNHHIKNHTIFIDDRRLFGSSEWSFVKEENAIDIIKSINPNYEIILLDGHQKEDIICAYIK
jgi:hypothetical protein